MLWNPSIQWLCHMSIVCGTLLLLFLTQFWVWPDHERYPPPPSASEGLSLCWWLAREKFTGETVMSSIANKCPMVQWEYQIVLMFLGILNCLTNVHPIPLYHNERRNGHWGNPNNVHSIPSHCTVG